MSRQYDAKQEAIKAYPNDRENGVMLFLSCLNISESDFSYDEGISSEEYIYGEDQPKDAHQQIIERFGSARLSIDVDPAMLLIRRSIAFADWAAGEGICPEMNHARPDISQEKNPDEFLLAYSDESLDDDYFSIADRLQAYISEVEEEKAQLKMNINQAAWEADNAKQERDKAEKFTLLLLGALKHCVIQRDEWLDEARAAIAQCEDAYR